MLPAIFPEVAIVKKVPGGRRSTVSSLCRTAGIECYVTGPAAERTVYLHPRSQLDAVREPGSLGSVSIGLPRGSRKDQAILALGILAYAVLDYAARESMRGIPEARLSLPPGRPRKAHPLSGAERMRRWRNTHCSAAPPSGKTVPLLQHPSPRQPKTGTREQGVEEKKSQDRLRCQR